MFLSGHSCFDFRNYIGVLRNNALLAEGTRSVWLGRDYTGLIGDDCEEKLQWVLRSECPINALRVP